MEDQYQVRTEDDLFDDDLDDYEDFDAATTVVATPPLTPPVVPKNDQPVEKVVPVKPKRGLMNSRFAQPVVVETSAEKSPEKPAEKPFNPPTAPKAMREAENSKPTTKKPAAKAPAQPQVSVKSTPRSPPANPPKTQTPSTQQHQKKSAAPTQPSPPQIDPLRLQSGANPRQKMTEEEISAKMAGMKIKAAAIEAASREKLSHAKAMEEEREQKELKVREEEQKWKTQEAEREKNRARRLQERTNANSGWDSEVLKTGVPVVAESFHIDPEPVSQQHKKKGLSGSRFATAPAERVVTPSVIEPFVEAQQQSTVRELFPEKVAAASAAAIVGSPPRRDSKHGTHMSPRNNRRNTRDRDHHTEGRNRDHHADGRHRDHHTDGRTRNQNGHRGDNHRGDGRRGGRSRDHDDGHYNNNTPHHERLSHNEPATVSSTLSPAEKPLLLSATPKADEVPAPIALTPLAPMPKFNWADEVEDSFA